SLSKSDVKSRAYQTIKWLVTHGVTHIRTHVDTTEKTLTGLQGLLELREELPNTIELQIVAFPQDGIFTDEDHEDLFREAINMGVDVVGGIPHNEYTYEDGIRDVKLAVELADANNLPVDLHIDETDDPQSRFTEVLANEARKHGIGARTTASHATAMHSYSDAYADKLLSLIAESNISVITNPPDNSVLQGRYDSYPRRRGHTRIDQLHDNDVTVGLGHDSVMDPWYHYGQGDPLDAAFILIHYAHMSGRDDVQTIWDMLTVANASILNIEQYGLKEGTSASLVVYDSPDPFNALRTQADRLLVMQNGEILAKTHPSESTIFLEDSKEAVTFHRETERDF
ncbi:MAG: amidohydrolase family protein, partial [Halobacteriaceae archaeon]